MGRNGGQIGRNMKKIVALMMACLVSLHANAAFVCDVKVSRVLVYTNGMVNVLHSGRGDYTVICDLNAVRLGVSPTTCAMWTGMLQAIMKKNGTATFYYDGDSTCALLPTYGSSPAPVYVGDVTAP
jgi:hypothetical protein